MMFMKILMAVILLSAVLSKESWAQKEPSKAIQIPDICRLMAVHLLETSSNDSSQFDRDFAIFPNVKELLDIYKATASERKDLIEAYNLIQKRALEKDEKNAYTGSPENKLREARLDCANTLGSAITQNYVAKENGPAGSYEVGKEASSFGKQKISEEDQAKEKIIGGCIRPESCFEDILPLSKGFDEAYQFQLKLRDSLNKTVSEDPFSKYLPIAKVTGKRGPSLYDPEDCACLESVRDKNKVSKYNLLPEIDNERKKLADMVARAAQKKFVNNYAALSEDMQYYAAVGKDILHHKGSANVDDKVKLCQDPAGFRKAVQELCKANGTLAGSEERMTAALSVIPGSPKASNFEEGLKELNDDIGFLVLDASLTSTKKPVKVTRIEYDHGRYGIEDKENTVEFPNRLITELLSTKELRKAIELKVSMGGSPYNVLMEIISNPEYEGKVNSVLKDLKSKYSTLSDRTFDNLITAREDDKKNKKGTFLAGVEKLLFDGSQYSPTFKNLLLNNEIFGKLLPKFNPDNKRKGMLELTKANPEILMKAYEERCENVQKELAMSVCTNSEEMLKRTNIHEIAVLSVTDPLYKNKLSHNDAKDIAICSLQMNGLQLGSPFGNLLLGNMGVYAQADYLDRKLRSDKQENSFYKLSVESQKEKARQRLVNMTSSTVRNNGIDQYKIPANSESGIVAYEPKVSRRIDSQISNSASANTITTPVPSADVHSASTPSRDIASTSSVYDVAKTPAQAAAPIYVPQVTAAMPGTQDDAKNIENQVARDKLARELSDTENKNRVREHISSVNEKDAEEIFRLRDQALKDRQTITDLRLQQERDKTEALRSEYEQLKARFDNLEKAEAAPIHDTKSQKITSGGTGSSGDGGLPHFETSSLTAPLATGGSTGGRVSAPISAASSAGSVSLGDSSMGSSNAAGAGSSVATTPTSGGSDVRGLALTVTQSIGADGKVSQAEDPNRALINYLTKNEPTEKQLQELKSSGLVLTEEDVSKDGQKVKTQKTFKFHELSPEAKSLVERKLAQVKLQEVKRNYSRQALILELFTASKKNSNLNVKKSGSLNF